MRVQRKSTPIRPEHFKLLEQFGKNQLQKKANKELREQFWGAVLQTARVPHVPLELVIEEWKKYVTAQSEHSSLAVNGNVDPEYTSVGVCFDRKITAAHTMKTVTLLTRLMSIYKEKFNNKDGFLAEMEALSKKVATQNE